MLNLKKMVQSGDRTILNMQLNKFSDAITAFRNKKSISYNVRYQIMLLSYILFVALSSTSCSVQKGHGTALFEEGSRKNKTEISKRNAIVQTAESLVGISYSYGGQSPEGFDCSGFTSYVLAIHGIKVGRDTKRQLNAGKRIHINKAGPGDLIFFGNGGRINHVGMVHSRSGKSLYVIHSTSSGGVRIDEINSSAYWKKRIKFANTII